MPYDIYCAHAVDLAKALGVSAEFPAPENVRTRRIPKQFQYESQDEPIVDPSDRFRFGFYYYILDIAIAALGGRFDSLYDVEKNYGSLYHINDTGFKPNLEQCMLLEEKLRNPTTRISDISDEDLCYEISMYASTTSEACKGIFSPIEFLNSLWYHGIIPESCDRFTRLEHNSSWSRKRRPPIVQFGNHFNRRRLSGQCDTSGHSQSFRFHERQKSRSARINFRRLNSSTEQRPFSKPTHVSVVSAR